MSTCDRYEAEALAAFQALESATADVSELGDAEYEAHFESCSDCQAHHESYASMAKRLRGLSEKYLRPDDAAVLAKARIATAEASESPRRSRWFYWAAPVAAFAAAALFLVLCGDSSDDVRVASLDQRVRTLDGRTLRGDPTSAQRGDTLVIAASVGESQHAELRVYVSGRELVLQCPGDQRCEAAGDVIKAELVLGVGIYQTLWLVSEKPIPPPAGALDLDLADAAGRGDQFELRRLEVVE